MDKKPHWLDNPDNTKLLWRGFLGVLIASILAEWFVHLHPYFGVDAIFGFNAWFGFLACSALVAVARTLAVFLKRPDTFYDAHDD